MRLFEPLPYRHRIRAHALAQAAVVAAGGLRGRAEVVAVRRERVIDAATKTRTQIVNAYFR